MQFICDLFQDICLRIGLPLINYVKILSCCRRISWRKRTPDQGWLPLSGCLPSQVRFPQLLLLPFELTHDVYTSICPTVGGTLVVPLYGRVTENLYLIMIYNESFKCLGFDKFINTDNLFQGEATRVHIAISWRWMASTSSSIVAGMRPSTWCSSTTSRRWDSSRSKQ